MTIYLYVKTHRKTGLKYLGKTEQDPHKYKGSGTRWINHIRKHGYDVSTEILCECETNEEIKERGMYYSELWNVVESKEWANLMEESGNGFNSEQSKNLNKKLWQDPDFRKMQSEKRIEQNKKQWQDPEYKKIMSELFQDPTFKNNMSERVNKLCQDPEYRKMLSETAKKRLENPKNHPLYDHTIYHFVHKNGTEEKCTRHDLKIKYSLDRCGVNDLVRGDRKSHRGWMIKINIA